MGVILSIVAKSNHDSALERCTETFCPNDAVSDQQSAIERGDAATGVFIGGLIAAGAGVTLWLTAPLIAPREKTAKRSRQTSHFAPSTLAQSES